MLTKIESEILVCAMRHARMEGGSVQVTSSEIARKDSKEIFSWKDLHSRDFPISKELYEDWILKNKEPISFTANDFPKDLHITIVTWEQFNSYSMIDGNSWSIYYTLTKPEISPDENTAIVQVTAYCPAGPPNYGSIFLLEKTDSIWNVKFNFGLFNQ
jgi:hypothetical protein